MTFSYRELFCGGKTFCCCLPVRSGVIIMSILGIVFGGVLSIILWFEVASTVDMTSGERAGFVVAGLVETLLFVASILGFVGAIVRKQLFLQIYAYFIYVHFLLNIGVACYLLYLVTHFSANAAVTACQQTIQNQQAKEQCSGLLKVARGVYFAVAAIVLLVELYVVLVVTRYVNQVRNEKRSTRASRLDNEEAFALVSKNQGRYTSIPSGYGRDLSNPSPFVQLKNEQEFDPYEGIHDTTQGIHDMRRSHPGEDDYGGGSWTHSEIAAEEKARTEQIDEEIERAHETTQGVVSWPESGYTVPPHSAPDPSNNLTRYSLSDPFERPPLH